MTITQLLDQKNLAQLSQLASNLPKTYKEKNTAQWRTKDVLTEVNIET